MNALQADASSSESVEKKPIGLEVSMDSELKERIRDSSRDAA